MIDFEKSVFYEEKARKKSHTDPLLNGFEDVDEQHSDLNINDESIDSEYSEEGE